LKSVWKMAARMALHQMGGLATLRAIHRRKFGVLMFHAFNETHQANVDALCSYITRHFEPVSLSQIAASIEKRKELPDNAIAITIDDGYRNFLLHGHPIFRRHRIPTTLYVVSGFSDGRLWLWPDQIEFGLLHTSKNSIHTKLNGWPLAVTLTTSEERAEAIHRLQEKLKEVPNEERLRFLAEFGALCGVEIPPEPPSNCIAMNWDELRAVASEGVEIGCHTETHPILSRLANPIELEREIRGAGRQIKEHLGMPVRHFCYPNGRANDIGEAAIRCVREAGYTSAVTCTWGMNTIEVERHRIRRIPFDSSIDFQFGVELLAGLHM
jgi:peptidoglycan/xylan/chitin deacetylase (PgdA/CDA1 family)